MSKSPWHSHRDLSSQTLLRLSKCLKDLFKEVGDSRRCGSDKYKMRGEVHPFLIGFVTFPLLREDGGVTIQRPREQLIREESVDQRLNDTIYWGVIKACWFVLYNVSPGRNAVN